MPLRDGYSVLLVSQALNHECLPPNTAANPRKVPLQRYDPIQQIAGNSPERPSLLLLQEFQLIFHSCFGELESTLCGKDLQRQKENNA